jgi:hypothetical protein
VAQPERMSDPILAQASGFPACGLSWRYARSILPDERDVTAQLSEPEIDQARALPEAQKNEPNALWICR